MKKSVLFFIAAMALSTQAAFAEQKSCYQAMRGKSIISDISDQNNIKSEKSLDLKLVVKKDAEMWTGEVLPEVTITAVSQTMNYRTEAIHIPRLEKGEYYVEVDGGSVFLTPTKNGYIANSDYLFGNGSQDRFLSLTLNKVKFAEIPCN